MRAKELTEAFDGDFDLICDALHRPRGDKNAYRLIRSPNALVPLLDALALTEEHPDRFPRPVDWHPYKEQRDRMRRKQSRDRRQR